MNQSQPSKKISSAYLHFPFCETKCHYCDFYSIASARAKPTDPERFEKALARELDLLGPRLEPRLKTIFLGGGTPSMTDPDSMARALQPLWKYTSIDEDTEWTMEANPSSIDLERMQSYRKLGVNRVSMGVQSLRDDHLKALGRVHNRESALQSLTNIFAAGFTNVSVDLLCGVPGQTVQDLREALGTLTQFPITHLSCYILTLAPHHRMFPVLPGEEIQLEHYYFLDQWMREHGFDHYEISNFAKPGFQAQHNLNYWKGESYLGLGPSAHSFDAQAGVRAKNFSSLHRYVEILEKGEIPIEWSETLTSEQSRLEKWMLATRLAEGFPKNWIESEKQRLKIGQLLEHGLIEAHPEASTRLRLTVRGFAVSEQVVRELIA